MTELTIHPSKKISTASVEQCCAVTGLTVTMRGSLKSLSANQHWHYKKGKEKGTLEITWLTTTDEIILSCKKNRSGAWIENAMNELEKRLK